MCRSSARSALSVESGFAAKALDVHLQDRGMVDEAVDRGKRHSLVWKYPIPFAKWLIGGDQQRAAFVARGDQFEQDAGLVPVLRDIGDVVENEQVVAVELGDIGFARQLAPRRLQELN